MTNRDFWDIFALTVITIFYIPFGVAAFEASAHIFGLFCAGLLCLIAGWVEFSGIYREMVE